MSSTSPEPSADDRLYVSRDAFTRGLSAIQALQNAGALRLLVVGSASGRSPVQFEIHDTHEASPGIFETHRSDIEEVRRVVWDISDVLTAVLTDTSIERFIEVRTDKSRWSDGEVEDADVAAWKHEQVLASFDIESLRRRAWAKASTRLQLIGRFDWEVIVKHLDDAGRPPGGSPLPLGLLRVQSEPTQHPLLGGVAGGVETVMVVDEEDIQFMIDSLQRLAASLRNIQPQTRTE